MTTMAQADKAARRIKMAYSWAAEKGAAVEKAIHNPDITDDAYDALLEAEDRALDKLTDALVEGTGGAITENEAYWLPRRDFKRLGELVARLQA